MNAQRHRESWADYTKAIAIFLMVLCHFGLRPYDAVLYINIFHMPLFFLISGYFDKGQSISKEFVRKNIRQLIIPYFFFSLCSFSICWISPYIHPEIYHNGTIPQTFLKAFVGMFLMEDQVRPYAFMPTGALWFLVAMFEVRIIFALICYCWRFFKIGIVMISVGCCLLVYCHFPFFSLDSAVLSLPFYMVGFFIKRYLVVEYINNRVVNVILASLFLAFVWFLGMKNGVISIDGAVWGNNIVLFYLNAIIGTLGVICLSRALPPSYSLLSKIGACTLTILGTHSYFNKVGTTFGVLAFRVSSSEIPIWYIVILSNIAVVSGICIDGFLTKCCPSMIGKIKKVCN